MRAPELHPRLKSGSREHIGIDQSYHPPTARRMLHRWLCRLSLVVALLLAAGKPADQLPKGQFGSPESVRALEATAVIGARQSVAIVKVERSFFSAKAAKQLDGTTFLLATLPQRLKYAPASPQWGGEAHHHCTRHKAYRARPPPTVTILFA